MICSSAGSGFECVMATSANVVRVPRATAAMQTAGNSKATALTVSAR